MKYLSLRGLPAWLVLGSQFLALSTQAGPLPEAELILKFTRLMETPAAEVVFRATSEGREFARRVYGSPIYQREELGYLARAFVESRPSRRSLEDLYKSLMELRSYSGANLTSDALDLFAIRELTLAPAAETGELRFLRFISMDRRSLTNPYWRSREAFLSDGILPSEVGANGVQMLLERSSFVRQSLLATAEGRQVVNAVFKRAGVLVPASENQTAASLVQILRREDMGWIAIDLGDRLHDLVGLQTHLDAAGVARLLRLDPRHAPELLVWKTLKP